MKRSQRIYFSLALCLLVIVSNMFFIFNSVSSATSAPIASDMQEISSLLINVFANKESSCLIKYTGDTSDISDSKRCHKKYT